MQATSSTSGHYATFFTTIPMSLSIPHPLRCPRSIVKQNDVFVTSPSQPSRNINIKEKGFNNGEIESRGVAFIFTKNEKLEERKEEKENKIKMKYKLDSQEEAVKDRIGKLSPQLSVLNKIGLSNVESHAGGDDSMKQSSAAILLKAILDMQNLIMVRTVALYLDRNIKVD